MPTGVIVLAHGSRGELGKQATEATLKTIAQGLRNMLADGIQVVGASLQFIHPTLEEAAAELVNGGAERIIIAPYFLFPGKHITEHIPEQIAQFKRSFPATRFILASNLGLDTPFTALLARRIREAAPDLAPSPAVHTSPIEVESMRLIENALPAGLPFSPDERVIVKRMVHASGDPSIVSMVRFSPTAIESGLDAIASGKPVFADVRMVAVGISNQLATRFSVTVTCALDCLDGFQPANGATRAAAAIRCLGKRLDGAIVAIGNAPTALLALLDLIDTGAAAPALVVGMPVGFVQAAESKQELMKRAVPYVTVAGTRGGSAMTVAAVNALLRLAVEKSTLREGGTRA